ncbi:MAG: hypothetical protein ACOC2W_04950, partial [bacterium]
MNFSDNIEVKQCRYKNDNNEYSEWEACQSTKSWLLANENGLRTVYYQVKDYSEYITTSSDTITLSKSGAGLDTTAPTSPV